MAGRETLYTFDFVRSALPPAARRVLEIGCGDGALASRLAADGLTVVALDSDPAAARQAKARGVDARVAEWPDFGEGGFDAVLFTRSLHHVADLEASVAAAFAALTAGGRLIVEDFAFEEADEGSLAWFRSVAPRLADDAWRSHDHDLHSASAMEATLRSGAARVDAEGAAYYFRYLAAASRAEMVESVFAEECEAIAAGLIRPLGRRWIASAP